MTKIALIVTVAALSVVLSSTGSAQRSQTNGNGNGAATKSVAPPRSKENGVKAKVFQPSAFERLWHSFATGEQGN